MKKSLINLLVVSIFAISSLGFAPPVLAYNPQLSATLNGNYAQITVSNANPYTQIDLYTRQSSSLWTVVSNVGQTDQSGYFAGSFSVNSDGTNSPVQMYVMVGGAQSSTVSVYPNGTNGSGGCGYYGCSVGGISLSQTSLNLNVGQTASVTAGYPVYGYSNNFYISSNSNSYVASVNISGNQLTVYGNTAGSTTISVCANSSGGACASLYVTVGNSSCTYGGCVGGLTLSQTSLNLSTGQSSTVSISYPVYGYTNNFYVSSNSNSGVASANISGNQLTVYANNSGSTTINVCVNGSSGTCASLYLTVGGGSSGGSVWFSPSSPSMYVGQSLAVSINSAAYSNGLSGSNNVYYVSNNTNSSVASASISGTVLNLYANQAGTTNITVCQNSLSFCGTLYVTVTGSCTNSNCGGSFPLSQTSVTLNSGQSTTVTAYNYGGGALYVSGNTNSNVVNATISGTVISLYAQNSGSSTVTVCASNSQCASIYVTVNGGGSYGNGLTLSQTSLNLNLSQTGTVTAYPSSGYSVYVASNSNSGVATYSLSGNTIYVYGNGAGSATLNVCANSGNCVNLYVTVGNNGCGYNGCGGSISLSPSSLSLSVGQTSNVVISGNGYYTISSNSNPNVVSAVISGSSMNVYGQNPGSTTLSICQNGTSQCASLYVTVTGGYCGSYGCGGYGTGGSVSLSQTNVNLNVGQSVSVNIYGGSNYYIYSNSNSGVASASISGSVANIYGNSSGNTTISVCQNNYGGCVSLYVTVSGSAYNGGGGLQYPGGTGGVLGASTYANGQLISVGSTVYIVYKNLQTAFASSAAFRGLGFSFSNVLNVGYSALSNSGYTVTTSRAQHPWGSWVKNGGNTVYFIHELGLIPVPDWATFLNNGGQASWIVQANAYDFGLPVLSPMTSSDSRLR